MSASSASIIWAIRCNKYQNLDMQEMTQLRHLLGTTFITFTEKVHCSISVYQSKMALSKVSYFDSLLMLYKGSPIILLILITIIQYICIPHWSQTVQFYLTSNHKWQIAPSSINTQWRALTHKISKQKITYNNTPKRKTNKESNQKWVLFRMVWRGWKYPYKLQDMGESSL